MREGAATSLRSSDKRQKHFGPNAITGKKGKGPLLRFLLQFHQPLIYILIAAAAVTTFLQEWVDAGVIFAVVIVNAFIGFIQEAKAVKAIEALAKTMTTEATVLRSGEKQRISSAEYRATSSFCSPVTKCQRICGCFRHGIFRWMSQL